MNVVNEETPESHKGKRQLRLQKRRERRLARLVRETREEREWKASTSPWSAKRQPKKGLTCCLFKTKVIANAEKMRPLNTELEYFKFRILTGVSKVPLLSNNDATSDQRQQYLHNRGWVDSEQPIHQQEFFFSIFFLLRVVRGRKSKKNKTRTAPNHPETEKRRQWTSNVWFNSFIFFKIRFKPLRLGYLCLPQDIQGFLNTLPANVADLPILVIRKQGAGK